MSSKELTVKNKVIVIGGPTASGKTKLAARLAKCLGTVVISADSRQFYKDIPIGTAQPSADELLGVPHYFIGNLAITEAWSTGDFEREGLKLLEQLFQTYSTVVVAGGSGLYIKSLVEGIDNIPTVAQEIRLRLQQWFEQEGLAPLQEKLKFVDPVSAAEIDIQNSRRVIRALEVFEGTGEPISTFRKKQTGKRSFEVAYFGIHWERETLYQRINQRVELMIASGLLEEVKGVEKFRQHQALQTIGYREIFDHLDGKISLPEATELIKQHTRQFAKRQLTYFRNQFPTMEWDSLEQLASKFGVSA